VTNDLDTLATALYVKTDDLLKEAPDLARWRPRVGIAPKLTDAELVTLAVMQALLNRMWSRSCSTTSTSTVANRCWRSAPALGGTPPLMAHRLGAEQVTTIEIDPQVAGHARKGLSDAGFGAVTTVVGDGSLGYPVRAPYDRVIATVGSKFLPYTWVAQTRPGGRIVALPGHWTTTDCCSRSP
jgi:hypothetical protein